MLIEIGNQVCINADGTTGTSESKLHMKKFTDNEIDNILTHGLRTMEIIGRKLPSTTDVNESITLLSLQISELCKMLAVAVSLNLRGVEKI